MPHTYTSVLVHYVFSTKGRRKTISALVRDRLCRYIGGIAKENGIKALATGATDDHVHVLLSLPSTMPVAKAAQLIKGGSSKWIHETFPRHKDFAWQEGYGAFSIGVTGLNAAIEYITNQERHHHARSFEQECREFLDKHGIEYDERFMFG